MKIIGHLDMDAFFASVEERDNPRFLGRAIVVGSDPENGKGRGVVSTANYKARVYGIHSAMPISRAWRLILAATAKKEQPVIFLEPNFKKYSAASAAVMEIIKKHAPHVEQASVDEAYFDLSAEKTYRRAEALVRKIKRDIWNSQKLTASAGIGPNKMLAKIAADAQKPNGFTVVGADDSAECRRRVLNFLAPLPVRSLPGVGPKTEETLRRQGIFTVADIRRISKKELTAHFGKYGEELYAHARGEASDEIVENWVAKSVGEQTTFPKDTLSPDVLLAAVKELARDVGRRFTAAGYRNFRRVVLTVRFEDFKTRNRSVALAAPTRDTEIIGAEALRLFLPFLDSRENPSRRKIRLVGVRVEALDEERQGSML